MMKSGFKFILIFLPERAVDYPRVNNAEVASDLLGRTPA